MIAPLYMEVQAYLFMKPISLRLKRGRHVDAFSLNFITMCFIFLYLKSLFPAPSVAAALQPRLTLVRQAARLGDLLRRHGLGCGAAV